LATVETFRIVSFDFDAARNIARFNYAFDGTHSFQEVVEFGGSPLGSRAGPGIESALRLLHLAAGVSYYKAAAPGRIVIETGPLSSGEAGLVHDLYDKGLREFAVTNGLDVPLQFEVEAEHEPGSVARAEALGEAPASPPATGHCHDAPGEGVAVPIGGGKDSIVLVEALKAANPPPGLATWLETRHEAHRGRCRPAARLDHKDRLAPVDRAQLGRGAQRPRADHSDRVADRRGSGVRLRI
jgi:hypothetical protein